MMSFESASVSDGGEKAILDGQMAVDRLVKVTVSGFRRPIEYTVQERFRRHGFSKYRDITITEWNHASGKPSELYKIKCDVMTYGYYHEQNNAFGEVVAIDVAAFKMALTRGEISYIRKQNPKRQDFICIGFDDLHDAGVVFAHLNEQNTARREFVAISDAELAEYF